MFFFKNYYRLLLNDRFKCFSSLNSNRDLNLNNIKILNINLNLRIIFYLFFKMLIEEKYFQLFYFYKFYLYSFFVFNFDKKLLYYFIMKIQEELNLHLFIVQKGFFFKSTTALPFYRKRKFKKKILSKDNYKHLFYNTKNNNFLSLNFNNLNLYKNFKFFEDTYYKSYFNYYLKILFYQDFKNLQSNLKFSNYFFLFKNKRYDVVNYHTTRLLFLRFFNLISNSILFNTIPFFIFPKYLENEVYILYSYLLYIRTSVLYNLMYVKWLVSLQQLSKFQSKFGVPCFFFILNITNSLLLVKPLKELNIPVSALITKNVNMSFFDYPIISFSQTKGSIYMYFFFIMRLLFFSLQKRKKIYWNFFIKYQIIYELKKKLIDY